MDTPHKGMVWGVGLNRTGTTSLAVALHRLGYPNLHYPDPVAILRGDWSIFAEWRGGSDLPVAAYYQRLDAAFPGSKFILTTREPEGWLRSIRRHFDARPPEVDLDPAAWPREPVYGAIAPSDEQFRAALPRHEAAVRAYFAGRPRDLLVVDLTAGGSWPELCGFLNVPVPDQPFPRVNTAAAPSAGMDPEVVVRHRAYHVQLAAYHKRLRAAGVLSPR